MRLFINRWLLNDIREKVDNMFCEKYVGSVQAEAIIQLIDDEIEHRGTIKKGWIFKRFSYSRLIVFNSEILFGYGEAVLRIGFIRWQLELRFKGKKYE